MVIDIQYHTAKEILGLLELMPDIVFIKDGSGHWLKATQGALELFGLVDIDYVGKTDRELAEFSSRPKGLLQCIYTDEQAWAKGEDLRFEEVLYLETGEKIVYDVLKKPIFNKDGTRRGMIVASRDITELKAVEDEVMKKFLTLKVKDTMKLVDG